MQSLKHWGLSVRECCDLPNSAQRWSFFHWFHELVPAESSWCVLHTWVKYSLPLVLGAPLCFLHLLLLINAHILNILLSVHSQSGLPALHTANNLTGTEPLLGWKEFGQTEDISPSEEDEREEGENCLEKLMTKPLSVSCKSPGAIEIDSGLWGIHREQVEVWPFWERSGGEAEKDALLFLWKRIECS